VIISKIIVPVINSNEDEYKIVKWNFNNREYVKKGEHIVTLESTKVAEEINSEISGYIKILYEEGQDVKAGSCIAEVYENKEEIKESIKDKNNLNMTITSKAKKLIEDNKISLENFKFLKVVKEKDVLEFIKNSNSKSSKKKDSLIIFFKEGKPYHAAIFLESRGIADLSLLGSRFISETKYNFDGLDLKFYNIQINNYEKLISFFNTPVLLTEKIIKKEKSSRGWFKSTESADFILNFRDKRSKDLSDINCIEWLVLALEKDSNYLPDDILTAQRLFNWAEKNLVKIDKKNNSEFFRKFYI
tara:strand:- start:480 stop:1385 length:906 start_codon:yes stop_codon:yes gene_type:complete